jgi:alpha-tubulin suppressor-like RCC1 family protein
MLPICLNDLTGHIFYGKKITNITIAEDTNTIDFMACDYEGNAYVWGKNDQGQLCTGDSVDRQTPIILNQIENSIFYNQKIAQEYNYIWDKGVGYESLFNYFLLDNGEIYYKFYNVGLPV